MRLFFALWPDAELRGRVAEAAAAIAMSAPGRRVQPESYHITLAFLGEVPAQRLDAVRVVAAAQCAAPCAVTLDRLELWASARALVLAASTTPAALVALSTALRAGAPPESRAAGETLPLCAHVTIGRKIVQAPVASAIPAPLAAPIEWRASSFCLVSSRTGGLDSSYTVVDTWPLLYEFVAQK